MADDESPSTATAAVAAAALPENEKGEHTSNEQPSPPSSPSPTTSPPKRFKWTTTTTTTSTTKTTAETTCSSDNDDHHDDEEAEVASAASLLDDSQPVIDLEGDEEIVVDDAMLRRILTAAAAQGIPLDFLAHMYGHDDNDDEPVEYPFDHPPQSLQDVAEFILSEQCQRIVVLAGAGMSVASGIPDFRSSNGLYATLQADLLTADEIQKDRIRVDPSYSLDHHLFLENPLPCLEVNREFVLGIHERKWKATLAHRFVELLNEKLPHKVSRLYTQNIDGLEDQCGLPHHKRIAVHGSMDEAVCAICQTPMPWDQFCQTMKTQIKDITGTDPTAPKVSTPIQCQHCRAPAVKPNIVLFRSPLPQKFFQNVPNDTRDADLLLILGTSLGVAPANRYEKWD